jgi:hypothetical protein
MEACPICRAGLNGASTCRRCRADLDRVQEIERLGQRLAGEAMLSIAEGDFHAARQWLGRARAVHATPTVRTLEMILAAAYARPSCGPSDQLRKAGPRRIELLK